MENKYLELNPVIDETVKKTYKEVFDYVFKKNRIRNIAISGIYGSGKSTVCESYFDTQDKIKKMKIIHVSLGNYVNNQSEENNQNKENRIEKKIIDQIIFNIKSSKIPLSNYQKKETIWWKTFLNAFLGSIFFTLIIIWIAFWANISNFNIANWKSQLFISFMLISTLSITLIFLYLILRKHKFKFSSIRLSKKMKIKNENKTNFNETILDKEMKELFYILKSSKAKVVIFEDLDRFNMVEIFTKLKELNFCLNAANHNKKIIRFFYLIKDSLFNNYEERTKFFDFIIPIMPVLNSNNFQKKFNELLKEVFKKCNQCKKCKENKGECEKIEKPSEKLLNEAAHFVNDMRLLKNLINEFKINWKIIKTRNNNLEIDKFFAMLLIKNFIPKEYDKLLKNEGSIYQLINQVKKHKFNIQQKYKEDINKIENQKKWWIESRDNDKFYYLARLIPFDTFRLAEDYIPAPHNFKFNYYHDIVIFLHDWYKTNKNKKETVYFEDKNYQFDFDEFVDFLIEKSKKHFYIDSQNKDILNYENKEQLILDLEKKILDLESKIIKCPTMTFSETIKELKLTDDKSLLNNINDLTKTLILEGFLDDTYLDYI